MKQLTKNGITILFATLLSFNSLSLTPSEKEDLKFLEKMVESICQDINFSGSTSDFFISGSLKANTQLFLAKLANLDTAAKLKYNAKQYEGFLREQLKDVYSTSVKCKSGLTNKFIDKFFPDNARESENEQAITNNQTINNQTTNHQTTNNETINSGQIINMSGGTISGGVIQHNNGHQGETSKNHR